MNAGVAREPIVKSDQGTPEEQASAGIVDFPSTISMDLTSRPCRWTVQCNSGHIGRRDLIDGNSALFRAGYAVPLGHPSAVAPNASARSAQWWGRSWTVVSGLCSTAAMCMATCAATGVTGFAVSR
jgi:hypothetical protein